MNKSILKKESGGFSIIIIVIILVFMTLFVLLILGSGTKKPGKTPFVPNPTPTLTPNISAAPSPYVVDTTDWKTYTNATYGFQLRHPKEFSSKDEGPKEASGPARLRVISFTDSNKNQFTVNIYPLSTDPNVNTTLNNLREYSGHCGSPTADKTIVSRVFTEDGVSYKQVAQIDKAGRNITDFCFFSPLGNLVVFRNSIDSTVIAMKQVISTLIFSGQKDGSGRTLYTNSDHKFALKYPKEFSLSSASADFVPPYSLPNLITVARREGYKNETAKYSQVANLAVSTSDDINNCYAGFAGEKVVNGTVYKTQKLLNAATGHSVEGVVLRTVKGKCYEVQTSIQTSNGGGDISGSTKAEIEVDRQKLQLTLDALLATFAFGD